jgi:hypothetical protein
MLDDDNAVAADNDKESNSKLQPSFLLWIY